MRPLRCYDSVTASAVPVSAVVLGYVDGDYRTYDDLVVRFKSSSTLVVPVTTGVDTYSFVIDCENGDATPEQAADWCRFKLNSSQRPTVYGTADTLEAVQLALRARRYRADLVDYWLADWIQSGTGRGIKWPRRLPSGHVGWQFATNIIHEGHPLDASVVLPRWAERHGWTGQRHLFKV